MGLYDTDWMQPSPVQITARQRIYDLINSQVRTFNGHPFVVHDGTDTCRVGCQNSHPNWDAANRTVCMAEVEAGYFARRDVLVQHFATVRSPHFGDLLGAGTFCSPRANSGNLPGENRVDTITF